MATVHGADADWQMVDQWTELLTSAGYIGQWEYTQHGENADEILHNSNTGTTIVLAMQNEDQEHLPQWRLEFESNGQRMVVDLYGRNDSKIVELLRVWFLI